MCDLHCVIHRLHNILSFQPSAYTHHSHLINLNKLYFKGTNTYLIGNGAKRILLDTGEKDNHDYLNCLKNYLHENGLLISTIIVSHWHPDHIGGLPNLVKNLNLEGELLTTICCSNNSIPCD